MRSRAAHNIDLNILSLYRYAKSSQGRPFADFIPPYFRPSVTLFERHCAKVIHDRGLEAMHIQGRAVALKKSRSAVAVELESGRSLAARHVILAIGMSDQPYWPEWSKTLQKEGAPVHWRSRKSVLVLTISLVRANPVGF